jgi:hypothetical protein
MSFFGKNQYRNMLLSQNLLIHQYFRISLALSIFHQKLHNDQTEIFSYTIFHFDTVQLWNIWRADNSPYIDDLILLF